MLGTIVTLLYLHTMGYVVHRLIDAGGAADYSLTNRHFAVFSLITTTAFLVNSYNLFILLATVILLSAVPRKVQMRITTFVLMFPLIPYLGNAVDLPGLPGFYLTWPRLLIVVLLLPLVPSAFRIRPMFSGSLDKWIILFFLLVAALNLREETLLGGIRLSIYFFIDYLVPYFVLSRHLLTLEDLQRALWALLASLSFVGLLCIFEAVRDWSIYNPVALLDENWSLADRRLGFRRGTGPLAPPSNAAFAMIFGLGLFWACSAWRKKSYANVLLLFFLTAGLFFTFARGSWIAALVLCAGYLLHSGRTLFRFIPIALLFLSPLLATDLGSKVLGILPFVGADGTQEARTITYRQDLFAVSIDVANENPWLGSTTFKNHSKMEAIRQSSGLLDLVNHYLIVLLNYGYVGLLAWIALLLSGLSGLAKAAGRVQTDQLRILYRSLFYTLLAMIVATAATSAVGRVGIFLWMFLGFAGAAIAIQRTSLAEKLAFNQTNQA